MGAPMDQKDARRALLLGASGLVGGHLLDGLLADEGCASVTAIVRRPLGREHPRLEEVALGPAGLPEQAIACDDVYCALGTTRARAGSREAFEAVDRVLVQRLASFALDGGARQFLLVSSIGADPRASSFYLRVKGAAEGELAGLGYESLQVFRPSLLLGDRIEHRLGERMAGAAARAMAFLMVGPLRRYRAIEASTVARAMIRAARAPAPGLLVHESDAIARQGEAG